MDYKGYLIDLDGTMYRGETAIQGAKEFIDSLRSEEAPHLFVTNNSTATAGDVSTKLNRLGIQASSDQIVTSAIACANYIAKQKKDASVYVVGEKGLHEAVKKAGCRMSDERADYVIVGLDRKISYEKIATASLLIQEGAVFISTNKDPAIPDERGLLPGNGAITTAIEVASGKKPFYIGKPEPIIMQTALSQLNLLPHEVIMIGDNYLTDITAGIHSGIDTLMVLTGYSDSDDVDETIGKPTYMTNDLLEWLHKKQALV